MLFETLEKKILKAMRNRDKETLGALRVLKSEIQKETIGTDKEITNELVEQVATKTVKQMNQALEIAYDEKNVKLRYEASMFMPKQVSKEEVLAWLETANITCASSGQMTGVIKRQYGNSIDGKLAMEIAKEYVGK